MHPSFASHSLPQIRLIKYRLSRFGICRSSVPNGSTIWLILSTPSTRSNTWGPEIHLPSPLNMDATFYILAFSAYFCESQPMFIHSHHQHALYSVSFLGALLLYTLCENTKKRRVFYFFYPIWNVTHIPRPSPSFWRQRLRPSA